MCGWTFIHLQPADSTSGLLVTKVYLGSSETEQAVYKMPFHCRHVTTHPHYLRLGQLKHVSEPHVEETTVSIENPCILGHNVKIPHGRVPMPVVPNNGPDWELILSFNIITKGIKECWIEILFETWSTWEFPVVSTDFTFLFLVPSFKDSFVKGGEACPYWCVLFRQFDLLLLENP